MAEADPEEQALDDADLTPVEAPVPKALPKSRRLGRYVLSHEIASGGMATVNLARAEGHGGFEKVVAIKSIHAHLAKDPAFVEMFMDEARIASRIDHPNVCRVFDFGHADDAHYIVMEYIVGETLVALHQRAFGRAKSDERPRLSVYAARIVADACEGLHAAHELKNDQGELLGLVHRDVSPHNLFVCYDGSVRLVDFGVAKATGRSQHTKTGVLKGKLAYMAPEQLRRKPIDRRADIWAMGVVLWELVTGKRLFRRESEIETILAIEQEAPPRIAEICPNLPPELDTIVSRALARDPAERYATAREMARDLNRYVARTGDPVGGAEMAEWMESIFGVTRDKRLRAVDEARGTISEQRPRAEPAKPAPASAATAPVRQAPSAKVQDARLPEAKTPDGRAGAGKTNDARPLDVKGPAAKAPDARAPVAGAPVATSPAANASVGNAPVVNVPVAKAPDAKASVAKAPAARSTEGVKASSPMAPSRPLARRIEPAKPAPLAAAPLAPPEMEPASLEASATIPAVTFPPDLLAALRAPAAGRPAEPAASPRPIALGPKARVVEPVAPPEPEPPTAPTEPPPAPEPAPVVAPGSVAGPNDLPAHAPEPPAFDPFASGDVAPPAPPEPLRFEPLRAPPPQPAAVRNDDPGPIGGEPSETPTEPVASSRLLVMLSVALAIATLVGVAVAVVGVVSGGGGPRVMLVEGSQAGSTAHPPLDPSGGAPPTTVAPGHEPSQVEPSQVEPTLVEPSQVEPSQVEPTLVEPSQAEPTHVEPTHVEPTLVEPTHVEPTQVEPSAPNVGRTAEPTGGEPSVERPRPAATGPGSVNVATPGGWAEVYVDGELMGTTPLRLTLPAGRQTIELRPGGGPRRVRRSLEVRAGAVGRLVVPIE